MSYRWIVKIRAPYAERERVRRGYRPFVLETSQGGDWVEGHVACKSSRAAYETATLAGLAGYSVKRPKRVRWTP